MDAAILAITKEGGGVLPLAINTEDRRLLSETTQVIGAAGVRQVVLHRFDPHLATANIEIRDQLVELNHITVMTPVAIEQRRQRPIRGVPVACRIVPAGEAAKRDLGMRKGHHIDSFRADTGKLQTEAGRLIGEAPLGVLVADEALLLRRCDQLAINKKRRRGVMADRAGYAQNYHGVDFSDGLKQKRQFCQRLGFGASFNPHPCPSEACLQPRFRLSLNKTAVQSLAHPASCT